MKPSGGAGKSAAALGMALGVVLIFGASGEAWNEPEAFKGVVWGSPPEELQRVLAVPGCRWVGEKQDDGSVVYGDLKAPYDRLKPPSDDLEAPYEFLVEPKWTVCFPTPIGGEAYKALNERIRQIGDGAIWPPSFHYRDNKMGKVVFLVSDHSYTKIREAFMAGYGSPTARRVQQYQNAFGARFDSEELEWVGKKVTITLQQRTVHDLTVGVAVYQTPEFVRADEAAKAAKAKRKPKGL